MTVSPGKTNELIEILLTWQTRVGPRNYILAGSPNVPRGRDIAIWQEHKRQIIALISAKNGKQNSTNDIQIMALGLSISQAADLMSVF